MNQKDVKVRKGDDIGAAWLVVIYSSSDKLNRYSFSEGFGFSVRCVKD